MSVREAPRANRSKTRVEPAADQRQPESTLHRLQARGERLLQWFPELRKTWHRDAEPSLEALVGQLQSLGGQVSRRAQETGRDLEARAERLLADLERQAVRGIGPLLTRANLASGTELSDLELRLQRVEERLDPLIDGEARRATSMTEMQTTLAGARADATERLRELTMRLAATEELQHDLGRVHEHVDALSRDQVSRSLEIGKLNDRLVRLEMRMGDMLKEQAALVNGHQDVVRGVDTLKLAVEESTRTMQDMRGRIDGTATDGRATDARLTALMAARNGDHDDLARITDVLGSIQQTLRQVDLRLGDLGERYAGVREELATLSARVSHLELTPTRPGSLLSGRTEGH